MVSLIYGLGVKSCHGCPDGFPIDCPITRYTHSVNASCSYKVQGDIICIHMNSLLEDVALL